MALVTLGKNAIGKQVIQEEVKSIQIVRGQQLTIRKEHDTIEVLYPFDKMYTTPTEHRFLIKQLSDIL